MVDNLKNRSINNKSWQAERKFCGKMSTSTNLQVSDHEEKENWEQVQDVSWF